MRMPIYLDYNATTPVDPRVVEAMLPCFSEHLATLRLAPMPTDGLRPNSSKTPRTPGGGHRRSPEELVFTSGATEANNLAIKGTAWSLAARADTS